MGRAVRAADCDDGFYFLDIAGDAEDRTAAKRMADQNAGCLEMLPQIINGAEQVFDIG